jgi:trimeric autotransporter adhesin
MRDLSIVVRSLFLLLFVTATTAYTQSPGKPAPTAVLNPDGSINTSVAGSFDPTGYRMSYGPTGEPRFVSESQPGGCTPDNWDTSFTTNGANDQINAIVSDGLGNIYIGGEFTSVQGVPASRIAKWNGSSWSALGTGVFGDVNAIAVNGTDVYVGGSFASAGGVTARNAAKWNGTAWSGFGAPLGGGTHEVEAVAIYNGEVWFGGSFNTADGSPANGLVRWDGNTLVGVGAIGQVYTMVVSGGALYVGGFINVSAEPTVGGVLKWDGVSWSGFGLLTSSTVRAIGINGADIYVGGTIRRTGNSDQHIAKWNAGTWTNLGFFSNFPVVHAFAFLGTDVYAGGTFQRTGGIGIGNGVLKYNGTAWSAIGSGTELGDPGVYGILTLGNTMYMVGEFQLAGGNAAKNIATLTDGTTWAAAFPGTGLDSAAAAIAVSGTDVYVGGSFLGAGTPTVNRIAKWNGVTNTWSSVGGGITGTSTEFSQVSAIAVAGGKVYAGGSFPRIGGVTAANIAVWNGSVWAPLGTGITGGNARVSAIVAQGDDVIVAGDFTTAGGVATNRLAKWNGTSWSGYPGNSIPSAVTGLAVSGSDIYVTTQTTASDNPNYLSWYNGTTWAGLAPGMGGHGLNSVVVIGSDVYVAGSFTSIGGVSANRVAKWNGVSWSALGGGLPQPQGQPGVVEIAASGPNIIAVGDFTLAAGGPADGAAKWNGSAWVPLGNGLKGGTPSSVFSAGSEIYAGGFFTTAGCNQSPYFARWRETLWTGSASTDWHNTANWGGGEVPPANSGITISANNATISSADVTVSSLIVTSGRTVAIGAGRTLTVTGNLDLSNGFVTGPGNLVVNDLSLNGGDVTNVGAITINGSLYLSNGKITGTAPVLLTSCRAGALSSGSSSSYIQAPLTRCVGGTGTFRFPVGVSNIYAPVDLANVAGTGNFTVDSKSGPYAGAATGLSTNRLQRWWNLTNTGLTQADLTFNYVDADVLGIESRYRVFRIDGGTATQLPTTLNQAGNRATVTGVTSFSPWTMGEGQSSPLTLSGRVTTASGRGGWGVIVALTDDQNVTRYTMTNPFGYYRFPNVLTFKTYTLQVMHKKFTFTTPQRTVEFDEFTPAQNFQSTDH